MRIPTRKPGKYTDQTRDPHMTQAKFDELKSQLARMLKARPAQTAEVKHLAEMGDFSENAAYQIAKGRLRGLNQRIMEIEDHLKYAKIITPEKSSTVQLGSTVTIEQAGKQQTFTILGPTETNPAKGIISHKSPMGAALMGKRVGDVLRLTLGATEKTIRILSVD
ncbi:MAG: GreA/GreB family elongation factor [Patescibacteria group bacterium]